MGRRAISFVLAVLMTVGPALWPARAQPKGKAALIQIAILLDTSNSMDGLIDQAKSQLWKIVNELSLAKKNGQVPRLEVALYEYGNTRLNVTEGYLRQVSPLTTDLDFISEQLFGLKTEGGYEYCGWAIQEATQGLSWSKSDQDLKLIFIAGNEEFNQGSVDYHRACQKARDSGILVNTIFCGSLEEGERIYWKQGAAVGGGQYVNIDQEQKTPDIPAPQDTAIAELNQELNNTFLAWAGSDLKGRERQIEQDRNARASSLSTMSDRALAKTTAQYSVPWDLVDAVRSGRVDLAKLEDAKLPFVLRGKSLREKTAYIESLYKKRTEIGDQIRKLYLEREKYIATRIGTEPQKRMLGYAVIQAVREQARAKGFSFE